MLLLKCLVALVCFTVVCVCGCALLCAEGKAEGCVEGCAELCADICAVDAIHTDKNEEFILEVNDTGMCCVLLTCGGC